MCGGRWTASYRALARVVLACSVAAIAIFAASVAVLALTLTFSSDAKIEENLRKALERRTLLPEAYPVSPYGHAGHSFDMYTDCIAFGTNLSNRDEGLWRRLAASPYVGGAKPGEVEKDACQGLAAALKANSVRADVVYLRFWHGYQAYIRPMLSVMSLDLARRINAIIFYGSLIFFGMQLTRWFGPWGSPAALLPFFFLGDFLVVPSLMTHSLHLTCIFLSAAFVPIIIDRISNAWSVALPVYAFAMGMLTNFVSFLVNAPMAPALIGFLAIAGALRQGHRQAFPNVLYAAGLAALWFAGYFTEWLGKWAFAALSLGPETAIAEVLSRATTYGNEGGRRALRFLDATWSNLAPNWITFGGIAACFVGALSAVAYGAARGRITQHGIVDFISLLSPLLIIAIWIEANPAHSDIHVGFVNRSFLLVSSIPILAALLVLRSAHSEMHSRASARTLPA